MERELSDLALVDTDRGVDGANAFAVAMMAAKIAATFIVGSVGDGCVGGRRKK